MKPTSVRKTPLRALWKRPTQRYHTVEFLSTSLFSPHRWLQSCFFPGFYVGAVAALKRRVRDRQRKLAITYRIVTHTRTRQGITHHVPGSEILP